MTQAVDISKTYSLEQYIGIEEGGTDRHEYYYGKLITMPGESLMHNRVCLKLYTLMANLLLKAGFEIFVENVKVNIENEQVYLYPDIVVIKDQPEENLPYKDYIIYQPLLIAEVLSDSTRKYDLTDKLIQYQKISSLQYYLAVEPLKHVVIFYEKDGTGNWLAKTFTGAEETIDLHAFGCAFTLAGIYGNY